MIGNEEFKRFVREITLTIKHCLGRNLIAIHALHVEIVYYLNYFLNQPQMLCDNSVGKLLNKMIFKYSKY